VRAGRWVTVGLFLASSATVYLLDTARDAFGIILQIGAGTGLLYLVRWFWWRVNAWCEIVAMTSSLIVSVALLIFARNGAALSPHAGLLVTVVITTVCWVAAAYLGPETDRETLISFYRKARPFGPGWERVRLEAGVLERTPDEDNIPRALLGWFSGCAAVWSGLFLIGTLLYGRWTQAAFLSVILLISGSALIWVMRNIWPDTSVPAQRTS
jgi:solute:Na+ symporter, SSS family